jgi:hypothetical protein
MQFYSCVVYQIDGSVKIFCPCSFRTHPYYNSPFGTLVINISMMCVIAFYNLDDVGGKVFLGKVLSCFEMKI